MAIINLGIILISAVIPVIINIITLVIEGPKGKRREAFVAILLTWITWSGIVLIYMVGSFLLWIGALGEELQSVGQAINEWEPALPVYQVILAHVGL